MGDKMPSFLGKEIPLIGITGPQENVTGICVLRRLKGGLSDASTQSEAGVQ